MARRSLDMLPLLDVFMVVLFVFATIQEGELAAEEEQTEELEKQVVAAQLQAATAQAQAANLAAQLATASQTEHDKRELEAQVEAYQRACGPRGADDPLCPAAQTQVRELAEVAEVHEQLLTNIAVFEIEIAGQADLESGRVINHCCFRADPPQGEWQRCGEVPTDDTARGDWFDDGADGLREQLRETRDGYAIVLVQQDGAAGYQMSKDFSRLLHERLREHYVYDNGVSDAPLQCTALVQSSR